MKFTISCKDDKTLKLQSATIEEFDARSTEIVRNWVRLTTPDGSEWWLSVAELKRVASIL